MVKEICKISLKEYDEFRENLLRFFDLYKKCSDKSLLFSALININFGIQDINLLIDRINSSEDYDSSWYYELIVKSYQILGAFDEISKSFNIVKSGYDDLYGQPNESDATERKEQRQKIDYFRALRSLTTAHTLKTTNKHFKKFGITNGVYLEDVRFKNNRAFQVNEGDIILEIRKEDENSKDGIGETNYIGIWIEKDIIEPVRIIISKLELVNEKIVEYIHNKEYEFKKIKIVERKKADELFLQELKTAVNDRYPKEITIETYEEEKKVEYWNIQEVFDFVTWDFEFGDERDLKLNTLQDLKEKVIYDYVDDVQDMQLSNNERYFLSHGISAKDVDIYAHQKIQGYLSVSTNYPNFDRINPYINNLSEASLGGNVSNETWACLLLLKIQPELDNYFKIEWEDKTLQEIYWQYLVALFIRQKEINAT